MTIIKHIVLYHSFNPFSYCKLALYPVLGDGGRRGFFGRGRSLGRGYCRQQTRLKLTRLFARLSVSSLGKGAMELVGVILPREPDSWSTVIMEGVGSPYVRGSCSLGSERRLDAGSW